MIPDHRGGWPNAEMYEAVQAGKEVEVSLVGAGPSSLAVGRLVRYAVTPAGLPVYLVLEHAAAGATSVIPFSSVARLLIRQQDE